MKDIYMILMAYENIVSYSDYFQKFGEFYYYYLINVLIHVNFLYIVIGCLCFYGQKTSFLNCKVLFE